MNDVRAAVAAAHEDNCNWMRTHRGIVDFILSECDPTFAGNDEYDNVILANPEVARNEAKVLDAEGRTFRVQMSLVIPKAAWARAYGNEMTAEGVEEFLQTALFVSTDHIAVSVDTVVDENE